MHLYKAIGKTAILMIIFFTSNCYASNVHPGYNGKCSEIIDPYEKFNRAMFQVNLTLDHTILKPVSTLYKKTMPAWGRDRVTDFISNLKSPLTILNNTIQGDGGSAFRAFWRFFINTTFGLGGVLDFASGFGLEERRQVFGDSFAYYGVDYGAYLMLPVIGPTTIRDATGKVYDAILDPNNLVLSRDQLIALYTANTITTRADYLDITNSMEENSLDYYAQIRSMYIQNKAQNNPRCKNHTIDYNMYTEEVKDE